ncbi:hypothetical protein AOQ84DRAFT_390547 [Glonium stellatum]|uniref:Fucose-specific lectin n=1 Tax=Glonium stellatum TaxID=574774 RepID=A0A8E2JQM9_9PEZI|nr:hypothetical protein AOQ84DRAFT_390547 [Glonium stellatum]
MDFTRLKAVSYDDPDRPGKKITRVYYQVNSQIRESCFDDDNGWYVRGGDVVAANAKPRSPISATIHADGKMTSIFYIDSANRLCRRVRTTAKAGDKGEWLDGSVGQPSFAMSSASQLSAVRTDEDEENLRVFYQSTDNRVRGIVSEGDKGVWVPSDLVLDGALPGTSLCAVAGAYQVRLYYQGIDKTIREHFSDPDTSWKASRIKTYSADDKAPITGVAWNYTAGQLQIRVFTLQNNVLVELIYDRGRGGWITNVASTGQVSISGTNPVQASALASVGLNQNGKFTIFYQPSKGVIAQYDSDFKRVQLGIPTARD